MSGGETNATETKLEEMSKKLNIISMNAKTILEKLDAKTDVVDTVGKERGKPSGSRFEEKQKICMEILNRKRIREPKQETFQHYKSKYDRENEKWQ